MGDLGHVSLLSGCKGEGDAHFGVTLRECASYYTLREL